VNRHEVTLKKGLCGFFNRFKSRQSTRPPINPLTLGMAYFGFSVLALGVGYDNHSAWIRGWGWVIFGTSVLLFVALFEKNYVRKFLNDQRDLLGYWALILDWAGLIIGTVNFMSGKGGWIVWVFIIFLYLWLFAIAGAEMRQVVTGKNKWFGIILTVALFILSFIKFSHSWYVQGVALFSLGVLFLLVMLGKIDLPEPS